MSEHSPQQPNPPANADTVERRRITSDDVPLFSEAPVVELPKIIQEAILLRKRGVRIAIARHREDHGDIIAIYTSATDHTYAIRPKSKDRKPAVRDMQGGHVNIEVDNPSCEDIIEIIEAHDLMTHGRYAPSMVTT